VEAGASVRVLICGLLLQRKGGANTPESIAGTYP